MKFFLCFLGLLFILLFFITFSLYEKKPREVGLLTDDYGIVTKEDLDQERAIAYPVPFSSEKSSSFNYWQCLKPEKYFLSCRAHYVKCDGWMSEMTFWILADGKKYNFGTTRSDPIEACRSNIKEIERVMLNQNIVCVSASYLDGDAKSSNWIIEHVKSKAGEWSMFERLL